MRFLLIFILLMPLKISHDSLILGLMNEKSKMVARPSFTNLPKSELKCLIDNAFYEARGEGHVGMLLVTQVVLNRAKQSNENYCTVIYKKYQFSWTAMKRLKKIPAETNREIERLVTMVHYGLVDHLIPNHLKSALFYHATYVKPYWSKKFDKLGYWGNHVFYH